MKAISPSPQPDVVPISRPPARPWSAQQEAIFDWFHDGDNGHLVVVARAGTGKTTTIIEAISRAPEASILLAAFNKRIAVELQERLANPNAEAMTLHSLGYSCVRRFWDRVRVGDDRDRATPSRADSLANEACGPSAPDQIKRLVAKLHTKVREIVPRATMWEEIRDLAVAFDCIPDDEWMRDGYDAEYVCRSAIRAVDLAAASKPANGIDFADMIFLPIRNRWLRPRYDLVVVDEAQDMSAAQLEIATGMLNPGGRMCVVGDDRQALYGFRGADTESLSRLKLALKARELGLNTTYRCGVAIVREAQLLVPDIEPRPNAHEGAVSASTVDVMMQEAVPGDYILSRTNAPLVKVALSMIRAGRRARVEGRDIGAGLRSIARKLATGPAATSMPKWLQKLGNWEYKEATKAEAANLAGKVDQVHDQADTLRALADGVSSVREIEVRIDSIFSDGGGAYIVCSSVHKAKGLEADRVYVLRDTLNPPVACVCGHRHFQMLTSCKCGCKRYEPDAKKRTEEDNCTYVAITRARNELVWIDGIR